MEYYDQLAAIVNENKALNNKAVCYLGPVLNYTNPKVKMQLIRFSKVVNFRIYNASIIDEANQCCSIVVKIEDIAKFNSFRKKITKLNNYVSDHPFYHIFGKNDLHTFVFQIDYPGLFDRFLEGKYSKMFIERDLSKIYKVSPHDSTQVAKTKKKVLSVCSKDEVYRKKFENFINTSLATIQQQDTWITLDEDAELDTLPKLKDELYYESN